MFRNISFDLRHYGPLKQGALAFALVTLVSLICIVFHLHAMQSWNMMLSPMLLFSCYNPIIGAFRPHLLKYVLLSMPVFVLLALYIFISGNFISDYAYKDSDELHLITVLIIVFYFLLNLVCLMFRGVLYMLESIDE